MKRAAAPPGRRGPVLLMLLVTCVATFAGIARVWTQIEAVDQGYRLARASRIHDRLLQENRALRIELQHLKRPDRVARIAARDLGLRPPEPGQVRRLRLSAVAPELASAPPRPAPPPIPASRRA